MRETRITPYATLNRLEIIQFRIRVTNTSFEKKQYVNTAREKSFVSRKNINVESNCVTLLIDRGSDGGCCGGVSTVTRLARRLFWPLERYVKNNLAKVNRHKTKNFACAKSRFERTRPMQVDFQSDALSIRPRRLVVTGCERRVFFNGSESRFRKG